MVVLLYLDWEQKVFCAGCTAGWILPVGWYRGDRRGDVPSASGHDGGGPLWVVWGHASLSVRWG